MHRTKVRVVEDALDANNTIARANRDDFDRAGVAVVNLMSAPGAGKTTLLERALDGLDGVRAGVLEGDVQGSLDADRLVAPARPGRRSSTRTPASAASATSTRTWCARRCRRCRWTRSTCSSIENVGNLVCPAEFRVGEDARIMVCSVTEGEDKPLKYPLMFRACELVLVNKIDLLPHLDFDVDRLPGQPRRRCTRAWRTMLVSARTGEGVDGVARLAGAAAGSDEGRRARGVSPAAAARARRRAARRAHRGQRGVLRGGGRAPRARCATHGRALRARRAAARARAHAGGALGRAPRRGRVRPPGDRRQARAAGDRPGRRGRRPGRAAGAAGRAGGHRRSPSAPSREALEARARARLPDDRLRGRRAPSGRSPRRRTIRSSPRSWSRRSTTCCGSSCTCSSSTAACSRAARRGRGTTRAPRLPLPVPGRARGRPRRGAGRRAPLGAHEGRRGRRAARADADRRPRRAARGRRGAARRPSTRGGRLLALGNGGSATDAMDVVADFRTPLRGGPARPALDLTEDPRSSPRSPTTSGPRRSSPAR